MFERLVGKKLLGAIAILPLLLLVFPYSAAAQGDGQKVYDANCAKCHGADGSGNTPSAKPLVPRIWVRGGQETDGCGNSFPNRAGQREHASLFGHFEQGAN